MNTKQRLAEFQDKQLELFFNSSNSEDLTDIWNTERWKKEVRNNHISENATCEWCGDEEGPFHPHHTVGTNWGREWVKACNKAFVNSEAYEETLTNDRYECPSCGLRTYYKRKTKSPKYRCNNCKSEFESPKRIAGSIAIANSSYDTKPYVTQEYYEQLVEWLEENPSLVREKYKKHLLETYINTDSIVVICAACHYNEEKTNNVRCKECGTFHKPNKEMCWECLVDKKGLQQCDKCDDGWYNPSKYDACSSCR